MEAAMKDASFLDTLKTVLFGFIGVRRKEAHEKASLNPVHVIFMAITGVVIFVVVLVAIVKIVTS
jgi:hypothetical protein